MSKIEVDTIEPQSGTTVTLGASGDTITVPSGATFNINGAGITSNGITEADQWRLTADLTGTNAVISSNLERVDTAGQGTLGTGMTESSGVFTFPSTGIWFVIANGISANASVADNMELHIEVTTNNSTYTVIALSADSSGGTGSDQTASLACNSIIDVTDTANVKVRFKTASFLAASILLGTTTNNQTAFTFIRLGDT